MTQQKLTDAMLSTDSETRAWKARFHAAKAAYGAGELNQCSRLLFLALEQAQALPEHDFAENACLVGIGAVHIAEGKFREALEHLDRAILLLAGCNTAALQELLAVAKRFHAEALIELGEPDAAERELQEAGELLQILGVDGAVQLAYVLCDLATLKLKRSELKQSKELILCAIDLLMVTLGPESPEYLRANMIYSIANSNQEEFDEAVESSIVRMQYQHGQNHPHIMRSLRWYLKRLYENNGSSDRILEVEQKFGVKAEPSA